MPPAQASPVHSSIAERYRVLLDIGRTLTGTLSPDALYRAIYRETARVLETGGFYITLYDEPRDVATIVFYADRGSDSHAEISYRGSDSEVIRTGRGSIVEDRAALGSLLGMGEEAPDITRSAIAAPLLHEGSVLGAISAQSYRARAYTAADLELLQGIADIAAVALVNARHVAALDRQRREAEQIEEIGRALTSSLDPQEVLRKVIDAALTVLQADEASVWLIERGTLARVAASAGRISFPEGTEWDVGGPVHEQLARARRPLVVEDCDASELVPAGLRDHLRGGSGVAVPLIVGNEMAGLLCAGSAHAAFFGEDATRVLQRLASQGAIALANARLHSSLQALSLTDALTGLPNRRHLNIHLEREVAAGRRGRELVVCIFDLDNFKGYNDSAGHLAGDDALRAFGQILADENRAMNLVARYGGDEFVSVLSESSMEGARIYVSRVEARIKRDPILGPADITASHGLAAFDRETMKTPEDVIHSADADLYRLKAERAR